ncbi:sulfurtransferase complex subunit TusD [Acinetobacter qingfengensis]|uniref:Sulfurtransferase TusD n=1 Tax=Acinetobacter qingfengensis TaxID=1262585 RepID=A0A1E7RC66_9GAMM|nr:sulfurtransferase complex subunit TusD [Acinetobacter qingfengensis]KAA8734826.1 sulfurtransferase complex subunit TusD [Acinetobacter qingfengensis]OEY96866.1 sulfurtransferase TusD [Acinetobacter qingfengensis]
MQSTLLLVTASPHSRLAYHALRLAQAMQKKQQSFCVFFYQDAVSIANQYLWRAEDEISLTQEWQNLHIPLPVCVSAALSRGITDQENATRHQLHHDNLAEGFTLTGLGTLADAISSARHIIQF